MNRQEKPAQRCEWLATNMRQQAWLVGLAGILCASLGCQVIGGLEELKLDPNAGNGGSGSGGSGGSGSTSSSSASSSSGVPIMGDIACGEGTICPVGPESACCYDHYKLSNQPYLECVNGSASTDGCNTAGGANGYETRIECQLPTHCATGTVCCGNIETISIVTWYPTLSCTTTCAWPDTVVCDLNSSTNACPMVNNNGTMVQTTCMPSEYLPSVYGVCAIAP
jgi:hypothetical protein